MPTPPFPPSGLIPQIEERLREEGRESFPGWFLDTSEFKEAWKRKYSDEVAQMAEQAMPNSLHLFHPDQVGGACVASG
jgi:hypothetical protein